MTDSLLRLLALLPIGFVAASCGDDAACKHTMALKFAPVFRLDKTTVELDRCLPGHPATTYALRAAGNEEVFCEKDISKLPEVPIFYHYQDCGQNGAAGDQGVVVIDYHIWYSHQKECLQLQAGGLMNKDFGDHKADWERIALHIENGQVKRVRYHQHSGSYSKSAEAVEWVNSTHPVAYVGQDSHGSYHDQGGSGNCLYFQDYRRFEDDRLKVEGWRNLLSVKNQSETGGWFNGDRKYLDGFPTVSELQGRSGCRLNSCDGVDNWVAATGYCAGKSCGCRKSEWCHDVPFGSKSDKKPCDDSKMNDITSGAKNLLGGLMDSAQVSRAAGAATLPPLVLGLIRLVLA